MQINVAQLLKETVGSSRNYKVDERIDKEDMGLVKGEIVLIRTNRGILAKGTATVNVTGICSRCLSVIDYAVSFNMEDEFLPVIDMADGSVLPEEFDESATIDDNNMLDLSEIIRQYTLLTMSTKPLCRPDCAGLCPSCGHNLNQGSCQCSSRIYDKRYSKLVHL